MRKRGPKPKGKVKIKWSPNFAYAIGLLVSDGCLSPNGRSIAFVSKDKEQIENLMRALQIKASVGYTTSGSSSKRTPRIQFGDVLFYRFLLSIGLMSNKSKVIGEIDIPKKYFFDFLRGIFDGDGSTYSYWDKRWRSSFMFYVQFASASPVFVEWLQRKIAHHLAVKGHITHARGHLTVQLKYAKQDGFKVLKEMYKTPHSVRLSRKYLKIQKMLAIVGEHL